jgi:hypothetical protein
MSATFGESAFPTPQSSTGLIGLDEERSGRPIQVTILENMDAIHSMVLDDQRISS